MAVVFNPQIDSNLLREFTKKCDLNKTSVDDAISQLIQAYLDGAIGLETKTVYTVSGSVSKQTKAKPKAKKTASTTEGKKRGRKPNSEKAVADTAKTETPVANLNE